MKKIIAALSLLFSVSAVIILLSGPVTAEAPRDSYSGLSDELRHYDEAFEAIRSGALEGEMVINMSFEGIREKDIVPLFTDVISSCPELFFINSTFSYSYTTFPPDHPVNSITLSYRMQGRELREAQAYYEKEVSRLAASIDPSLSDAEKALFVHDYLISVYSYDTDLRVYDTYGLITGGSGVCRAYSLLYMDVLGRLGIDCAMVISDEMVHAWNIVKIDGRWYHVDLTYDDPLPERTGQVLHDYFLLSDEEIAGAEKPHSGWRSVIQCALPYSGRTFWAGIKSRMAYQSGYWYYIDEGSRSLMRVSAGSGKTRVTSVTERWYSDPPRTVCWAGMCASLAAYGGYVIDNTPDAVMAFDPSAGTVAEILSFGDDRQIIGIAVSGDELLCQTGFNVNADNRNSTEHIPLGDLDFSGREKNRLPFSDVSSSDPYYSAILYVYENGLFRGVSETEFAPEAGLTRAMFVTVLGRLAGADRSKYENSVFSDVPEGEWYTAWVTWAYSEGLVSGTGKGKFSPDSPLTREQMYKMAHSFLLKYLETNDFTVVEPSDVPDFGKISPWAREAVCFCYSLDIMKDLPAGRELRPLDRASRKEAAFVVSELSRVIGNIPIDN